MALLLALSQILLQGDNGDLFGSIFGILFSGVYCVCWAVFIILVVVGLWRVYVKAGEPGWAAIIPIYNIWVLLRIVGREGWWIILFFIPIVNIVVGIIVAVDLAKSFGKSPAYGVILLFLFNVVGYLMLGYGDAQYIGPAAAQK